MFWSQAIGMLRGFGFMKLNADFSLVVELEVIVIDQQLLMWIITVSFNSSSFLGTAIPLSVLCTRSSPGPGDCREGDVQQNQQEIVCVGRHLRPCPEVEVYILRDWPEVGVSEWRVPSGGGGERAAGWQLVVCQSGAGGQSARQSSPQDGKLCCQGHKTGPALPQLEQEDECLRSALELL